MTDLASASLTARARARIELTNEIKAVARRHLALEGSAALSLRAVARDLGMVSSAVYRYFPSRDDLLTALIVDAFDAVGLEAEEADARCRPSDVMGRWLAVCRAVRGWAIANPHEYALVYGSPVPGYRAPEATIQPATRVPVVLVGILAEAVRRDRARPARSPLPRGLRADLRAVTAAVAAEVPEPVMAAGIAAWTLLFGAISFELFGHLHNVIEDKAAWFELEMEHAATAFGLFV